MIDAPVQFVDKTLLIAWNVFSSEHKILFNHWISVGMTKHDTLITQLIKSTNFLVLINIRNIDLCCKAVIVNQLM